MTARARRTVALWERSRCRIRDLERSTRPVDPEVAAANGRRWSELPAGVRTPSQMIGRKFTGCEATHGVFLACDFGCERDCP